MLKPTSAREFVSRTGIDLRATCGAAWSDDTVIVSLRDLVRVDEIKSMPLPYLLQLLRGVGLADATGSARPYALSDVRLLRVDPRGLLVGQSFAQRGKLLAILEDLPTHFRGFCVSHGPAKMTAIIALGRTANGEPAVAHYLPPIIERHGMDDLLLDGIHRSILTSRIGTTIESVVISNVAAPFPCDPRPIDEVALVDAKPPRDQRYFGLRPELFRDLEAVGIDG